MSIKWTPALAVGVSAIDQQHKELFDHVAKLIDAMKNSDAAEVGRLMDFLGAYVVEHFRMEEGLMQRYAYPTTRCTGPPTSGSSGTTASCEGSSSPRGR